MERKFDELIMNLAQNISNDMENGSTNRILTINSFAIYGDKRREYPNLFAYLSNVLKSQQGKTFSTFQNEIASFNCVLVEMERSETQAGSLDSFRIIPKGKLQEVDLDNHTLAVVTFNLEKPNVSARKILS